MSTILATEGIYHDHNHGCLYTPQANTDQALKELYRNISEQETTHPDAAFIITGDFNKANFRTIAPKYFQHVTINTRGDRILDHCYTSFRDAYKSLPRPPFGKSDHSSVLLLPAYRQKLKCEAPALRTIQCWSDQSDATLQDCFDHVDWDMFRAASDDDIEAYSDSVTCFIRKCIDDVVPTKTIRIYPNQKPWINSDVRSALSARTSAFKSGNTDDRKQTSYDLRRSIKAAKRTYKNKVEEHFNNNNPRSMWQDINNITGFKGNKPATVNIAASLPDELNTFYARFEADNTAHTESAHTAAAEEVSPLTLSVADVTQSFKRVNIRKAVGPDDIPVEVCTGSKLKPEPGPYPRLSDPTRPDPSGTVKFRARTRPEIPPPTNSQLKKKEKGCISRLHAKK